MSLLACLALLASPLVPAKTDLARPVPLPRNPFYEPTTAQVKLGYKLFTRASGGNSLRCSSCHLDAGQKELALPLAGIAKVLEGRELSARITACYEKSLETDADDAKVDAIAAYLRFISEGVEAAPWRGKNVVGEVPLQKLDARRGDAGYRRHCAACHGTDGQGVQLDKVKPAALWGNESWSDGAPFARVYVLAGYVRHAMPYWAPGSLDDLTALDVALFIDTQDRPESYGPKDSAPDAPYAQRGAKDEPDEPPRKARGKRK